MPPEPRPLTPDPFTRNLWYFALPASAVKQGKMVSKQLLGEPIFFARMGDGKIFALRDICPHRGMPLSYGKLKDGEVECCYHGWRFNSAGTCTCIPSLAGLEDIQPENIKVRSYKVEESQGAIWIFMDDPKIKTTVFPPVPKVPDLPDTQKPFIQQVMMFPCYIDHAVIGLLDPAHAPFVHQSWWWRTQKSMHEKSKKFGPSHLGFTMLRHKASKNSFGYKLFGAVPETEISFQIPGIRIDHTRAGKRAVGNMTCVTPISDAETEITHFIYLNSLWLRLLWPIVKLFTYRFLNQDRVAFNRQRDGLKYDPNLMLVRDADTQARWYQQIKNEHSRAQEEGREFNNPVKETVLKWRT